MFENIILQWFLPTTPQMKVLKEIKKILHESTHPFSFAFKYAADAYIQKRVFSQVTWLHKF